MKQLFITFPRIEAPNFNGNAGAYVAGVPQPTAICGLVHAFCHAWNTARPGELATTFASVAYAVSQFSGLQGQSRNPKSQFSQKSGVGTSPSAPMTDRPRASMVFGLVISLTLAEDTPSDDATLGHAVTRMLESLRLNGASLWVKAPPVFNDDKTRALNALPADAFLLSDESTLLLEWLATRQDLTVAQALGDLCARPIDKDEYKPRYVPVVAGLHRLTPLATLPGARMESLHAYAEPVIGLARFRSAASVRRAVRLQNSGASLEDATAEMPDGQLIPVERVPRIFWGYDEFSHGEDLHLVCAHP